MNIIKILLIVLSLSFSILHAADRTIVDIETNYGTMTVELFPDKAPITVANFLTYVDANYYTDLIFHRVISGFVIQGGTATEDLLVKSTLAPIQNEADNGLNNDRGTIAMARTSDPHSATSQFYFNLVDNDALNYTSSTTNGWGYAVFGEIIEGLDVMDKIGAVQTGTVSGVPNLPLSAVKMLGVRRREAQLNFDQPQSEYQVGETLTISLNENDLSRTEALDLWVGLAMPDGSFLYFTGNSQSPLSTTPTAFQTNVASNTTLHNIYSLNVSAGLSGTYTLYAVFNSPGSDLNQLSQTLRSNIASTQITIK